MSEMESDDSHHQGDLGTNYLNVVTAPVNLSEEDQTTVSDLLDQIDSLLNSAFSYPSDSELIPGLANLMSTIRRGNPSMSGALNRDFHAARTIESWLRLNRELVIKILDTESDD